MRQRNRYSSENVHVRTSLYKCVYAMLFIIFYSRIYEIKINIICKVCFVYIYIAFLFCIGYIQSVILTRSSKTPQLNLNTFEVWILA